jgi:mono/diheme cytochrome c family protein
MLGRVFLVVAGLFLVVLGFAFYQDASRPYIGIQQQYAARYGSDFDVGQVQQLFPKVQVNGNFQVERCITCHVPDIVSIGPQEAARRLGPNHPSIIDDTVFGKYGQDTLICRPAGSSTTAGATTAASPSPSASARASASPSPSPVASASAHPAVTPAQGGPTPPASTSGSTAPSTSGAAAAHCFNPNATPYYVLDVNGQVVKDPQTGKPEVAQLTGFIPSQFKGLGIDESGCIVCHNGDRQGTTQAGAHQNLVPNPFSVYDQAPQLFESTCAQCHGATGEGLKGPPLNDQDRLGFFNDDYYQRCIYLGNKGSEHLGSIMPAWGLAHILPQSKITLLIHWIRLWQSYFSLP